MNTWKVPPAIKVYEALGAVAGGRIQLYDDHAEVFSSDARKKYTVIFDLSKKIISANDNGSYWQKYLGYPSIAVLMVKNIIPYDSKIAKGLKNIPWKIWNDEYHQDYSKTIERVHKKLEKLGVGTLRVQKDVENILEFLRENPYYMPEKLQHPPRS